jgi:Flp pilus assembly protein TadG
MSTALTRARSVIGALRRDQSGQALVEFALVLPILLILLLGALDFGMAYNYWIDTTHLSASAARWAAVNKNPGAGSSQSLQEYIRDQADSAELRAGGTDAVADPLEVCITYPDGTSNIGDPVQVTVSTSYNFLNYLQVKTGVTSKTITGSTTMRLEQVPTNFSAGCS